MNSKRVPIPVLPDAPGRKRFLPGRSTARFAYNHMLWLRTDAWYQRQKRVGYHKTSAALTALGKPPGHA
ncbi:helix-turn-helix domain-containing protein [Paraburkholderia humisilvae]|uniref:Transposase putative helix-turn-helix domain-containing protein n=1 Tax=Paraburkholderia humisilvae TaxID=627669 RepID=A0A6J5F5B5_9BURK|nr:hypothetical protein LMG29542_07557 [Paraburkholderia humisilvae]